MLQYKVIEIFTGEEARWEGKPLYSAVVEVVNSLKIAARAMVTRGIEGSYESGEMATGRIEVLSYNLPVRITIVLPAADFDRVLSRVVEMVTDGIIATRDVTVVSHKTKGLLMPRQTRVREIMTPDPRKVGTGTPLDEVARILLSSAFTGLPVVDEQNRPVGVISQGDLIYKAGMPMRLGLLAASEGERIGPVLESLAARKAGEVMTRPAVTVAEDDLVTDAVALMLEKGVKRLPVVDAEGRLAGMLSRVDVFRTAMKECPDWESFRQQDIQIENLRHVSDIMRRDVHTVAPDTPVEEVLRTIDCNDIQRVCVVDRDGKFLGLISDRDLLIAFSDRHPGIWDYFVGKIPFTERGRRHRELREYLRARTAAEVMNTDIVTIREDAPIEEAIRVMLDGAIKRLPVLDEEGKFRGMISRDSLLRTGFSSLR